MKWINLSLGFLPLIAIETDRVISQYERLKQKASNYARNSDIVEFNSFRQEIKRRILMLDKFYERYYLHQQIHLFHLLKLKLQRLIFMESKVQNNTIEFSMIGQRNQQKQSALIDHILWDQPLFKKELKSTSIKKQKINYQNNKKKVHEPHLEAQINSDFSKKNFLNNQISSKNIKVKQSGKKFKAITQSTQNLKQIQSSNDFMQKSFKKTNINKERQSISPDLNQSQQKVKKNIKTNKTSTLIKNRDKVTDKNLKQQQLKKKNQKIRIFQQDDCNQKTEPNQKTISYGEEPDSQFRFTIKMTKDQYRKLLQMKKDLIMNSKKN